MDVSLYEQECALDQHNYSAYLQASGGWHAERNQARLEPTPWLDGKEIWDHRSRHNRMSP